MKKQNFILGISCICMLLAVSACSAKSKKVETAQETSSYQNPIYANDFPDPAVFRASNGTFYVYATNGKYMDGTYANVRLLKSDDLIHWAECPDAMPTMAPWANENSQGFYWAPHVLEANGKYYLYFCANHNNPEKKQMMGIGVAIADRPEGPFIPEENPIVWGEGFEHIDPFVYIDPADGRAYFYWGSGFEPLKVQELSDDLLTFKAGSQPKEIIPLTGKDYEILLEGAWLTQREGYYYMFYSGDNCCGEKAHYAVLVARSKSPLGPFTTISEETGSPDNTILVEGERWLAPGHNSVIQDDNGNYWLLYHAIDEAKKNGDYTPRDFLIDKITWDENGWPKRMAPSTNPTPAPYFKK